MNNSAPKFDVGSDIDVTLQYQVLLYQAAEEYNKKFEDMTPQNIKDTLKDTEGYYPSYIFSGRAVISKTG